MFWNSSLSKFLKSLETSLEFFLNDSFQEADHISLSFGLVIDYSHIELYFKLVNLLIYYSDFLQLNIYNLFLFMKIVLIFGWLIITDLLKVYL